MFWASSKFEKLIPSPSIPLRGHLYFVLQNVARRTNLPGRASGTLQIPTHGTRPKLTEYYSISIFEKISLIFAIKFCSLLYQWGTKSFLTHFLFSFPSQPIRKQDTIALTPPWRLARARTYIILVSFFLWGNWPANNWFTSFLSRTDITIFTYFRL